MSISVDSRGLPLPFSKSEIVATLTPANHRIAVALAAIPERIRGYGHVKDAHLKQAKAREAELLAQYRAPTPAPFAQAAE